MRFCPDCGTEVPLASASCRQCGMIVRAEPPASRRIVGEARWIVTPLAGVFFVLALFCNLLIIVANVPDLSALWFSSTAAILPAIGYSLLVVALDRHEREPWRVLLGAFGWGATVATLFSLLANTVASGFLGAAYGPEIGGLLTLGLGAPVIEETFKGVALLGLLLMFRGEFDNILDGLVYGALIGLGFAMTENILYLGQAYLTGGSAGLGELFVAREVFGGFGHALYTATTGVAVGWARGRHGRGRGRFIVPVAGWSLAVLQHFLWNTGAVVLATLQGPDFSLWSVVILEAALFILPGLIVLYSVATIAHGRELRIIREQLAEEVGSGVLTQGEYDTLAQPQARRQASRAAWRRGGPRLWATQQRFFQAAAELAFCKHHQCEGEAPNHRSYCAPEDVYRARLVALREELAGSQV